MEIATQQPRIPFSPGTAGEPSESSRFVMVFAFLILFLIYSRSLEIFAMATGIQLPYVFSAMLVLLFLMAGFSGRMWYTIRTNRPLKWLLAFSGWMLICIPFSYWRSGSIRALIFQWIPTVVGMLALATLLNRMQHLRRAGAIIAASSLIITLASFAIGNYDRDDRVRLTAGSLGNSNDLAMLVLTGIPFLVQPLLGRTWGMAGKLLAVVAIPLTIVALLRTGSRAAFLSLLITAALMVLFTRGAGRVKLVFVGLILTVASGTVLSERVVTRLKTLFERNESVVEATMSQQHRIEKLTESIVMTFRNPLVGVGPGVHDAAQAAEDSELGVRPDWQVSHNTLTQVSSETGLPGFFFYAVAIFGPAVRLWRIRRRAARSRAMAGYGDLLTAYLLTCLALIVTNCFGSNAYLFFLPLFMVLADNVCSAAEQTMQDEAAARMVEKQKPLDAPAQAPRRPRPTPRPAVRPTVRPSIAGRSPAST